MPFSPIVHEDVEALVDELGAALSPLGGTTILITGAAGFLMSYLVDVVMAWNTGSGRPPCRVLALDNFKTGLPERLAHHEGDAAMRLIAHDISKPLTLDEPVHWIVHGASIASPMVYRQFPLETLDADVGGTHASCWISRGTIRFNGFVVMSTSEIYGDPDPASIPTPEDYRVSYPVPVRGPATMKGSD